MKNAYFAQQPIVDVRRRTVAYELLFRNSPENAFPDVDAEYATKHLLSDCFLGSNGHLLGNKICAVNFPYKSLLDRTPTLFSRQALIIDIQESCPPSDELLEAIKEFSGKGYKISLDNFIPNPEWKRFLPYINLIRFDIRTLPIAKFRAFCHALKGTKIRFLAEKIESYEQFEKARDAGFQFFQGYFISKPEMIRHQTIQPTVFSVVQLCKAITKKDIDYAHIEKLVTSDVTLSYKLLRFVNANSAISSEIKSFHQAVVYLGEEKLKKFISLAAISTIKEHKPESLYSLSLQRAKFCELLALNINKNVDKDHAFLTGLFSLLSALLDQPVDEIVDSIPIEKEIGNALVHGEGLLGKILSLVVAYERAEWELVDLRSDDLGTMASILVQCYEDSIIYTQGLFSENTASI